MYLTTLISRVEPAVLKESVRLDKQAKHSQLTGSALLLRTT